MYTCQVYLQYLANGPRIDIKDTYTCIDIVCGRQSQISLIICLARNMPREYA